MALVFLLLFLPLSHRSNAMTGCHSDRDKDHRPRVNCTATNLSDVPASIDTTTRVLIFTQNLFSSLTWSSYSHFPELYEIDLSHNAVPEVPLSPGPVLPTLGVLRLVGNRIRTLPPHSFRATPGLLELYLDQNVLETLDDLSFSGLRLLQILELSQNRISVLPPLMFRSLPAIETLILEQNRIRTMPDQWFSAKPDVPYTYLSQNPWACFCKVGYLKKHLDDQGFNVYTRDGIIITPDEESVTCATPPSLAGRPIVGLEDEEYCSPVAKPEGPPGDSEPQLTPTLPPTTTTTRTTTTGATTTVPTTFPTTTTPTTTTTPATTTTPTTTATTTTTVVPTTPATTTTTVVPTTTTTATLKPTTPPLDPTDPTHLPLLVNESVTWSWWEIVTILVEWEESRAETEEGRVGGGNSWEHHGLYRGFTRLSPHPTMTTAVTPRAPTQPPRTPTQPPRAPTQPPRTPTQPHRTPTQPPRTPTQPPRTPTQPPRTPTQPPRTPTQPPRTPTQPPRTPTQPPRTPTQPPPPRTPTQPPPPRSQTLTAPVTTVRQVGGSGPWGDRLGRGGGSAAGGRAVFCWWLFAGCVLLCVLSGGWVCVSGLWLWRMYRTVYRPLLNRGRGGGGRGVRLLRFKCHEGGDKGEVNGENGGVKAISLPLGGGGGGGGVHAIYRSVLFISREEGEREGEEAEMEEGESVIEMLDSAIEGTAVGMSLKNRREGGEEESEGGIVGGVERKDVYRKSLYRVYSREEKIEGLRDVEESWQTEEGGRKGGGERGGGGREAKKRYSLVLREESVEGTRGREREGQEKEWVVGGWEMPGGERREERGNGGGDWWSLLPSMPWCNPPPDPHPNPPPERHT
ncbi:uncharacterized protein gp1ba isoform 1-T1 [Salvelinus alpinus]